MKKTFAAWLCFLTFAAIAMNSLSAHAQDLFFLEPATKEADAPPVLEQSQLPVTIEEYAKQYYGNCIMSKDMLLPPEPRKLFCSCTAARLIEEASIEDIQVMSKNTNKAQQLRRLLNIAVYTPCVEPALHDMVYDTCISDESSKKTLKYHTAVCGCLADKFAEFWRKEGLNMTARAAAVEQMENDPINRFLNSRLFESKQESFTTNCIYMKEFGWESK